MTQRTPTPRWAEPRALDTSAQALGRRLAGYWWTCTQAAPLVGLGYLLLGGGALLLGLLDLREQIAWLLTPSRAAHPSTWFLARPWTGVELALYCGGPLALAVLHDGWQRRRARRAPTRRRGGAAPGPLAVSDPARWVVGRRLARTWDPEQAGFTLTPTDTLYTLGPEHLATHTLLVAPTAGGKTFQLRQLLAMLRRVQASVIVWDFKGDGFTGLPFDYVLSTDPAECTFQLNIADGLTPTQVGEVLASALLAAVPAKDWYFKRLAEMALPLLLLGHHTAYGTYPTLRTLVTYLRTADARRALLLLLVKQPGGKTTELYQDIRHLGELSGRTGENQLGTLEVTLGPLATVADQLLVTAGGVAMRELLRRPGSVRLGLPYHAHPELAALLGQVVLALHTQAGLTTPPADRDRLKVGVIDEAGPFITERFTRAIALGREYGLCYVLAFQTLQQIADPTLRQQVFDIPGTRLALSGIGEKDAELFSKAFGEHERLYRQHGSQESRGQQSSRQGGAGGRSGAGWSAQESASTQERWGRRPDWLAGELHQLAAHHAVVEARDRQGGHRAPVVVDLRWEEIEAGVLLQELAWTQQQGWSGSVEPPWIVPAGPGLLSGPPAGAAGAPPGAAAPGRPPASSDPPGAAAPEAATPEAATSGAAPAVALRPDSPGPAGAAALDAASDPPAADPAPAGSGGPRPQRRRGQADRPATGSAAVQVPLFTDPPAVARTGDQAPTAPDLAAADPAPVPPQNEATPDEQTVGEIVALLAGLPRPVAPKKARALAVQTVQHGRTARYVRALIGQISGAAGIRQPTGLLVRLLHDNVTWAAWCRAQATAMDAAAAADTVAPAGPGEPAVTGGAPAPGLDPLDEAGVPAVQTRESPPAPPPTLAEAQDDAGP